MIELRASSAAVARLLSVSLVAATISQTAHAQTQAQDNARIVVESTKPDVEVSIHASAALGTTSNGAVVALRMHRDLCVAPCAFSLPPGRHTLVFHRDGSPNTFYTGLLRPGETRITVKPGVSAPHGVGYALAFLGGLSLLTGGIMYGVSSAAGGDSGKSMGDIGKYMVLGGVVGLAAGIPIVLLTGTDLDVKTPERGRTVPDPLPPPGGGLRSASRALGVGYAAAF